MQLSHIELDSPQCSASFGAVLTASRLEIRLVCLLCVHAHHTKSTNQNVSYLCFLPLMQQELQFIRRLPVTLVV